MRKLDLFILSYLIREVKKEVLIKSVFNNVLFITFTQTLFLQNSNFQINFIAMVFESFRKKESAKDSMREEQRGYIEHPKRTSKLRKGTTK